MKKITEEIIKWVGGAENIEDVTGRLTSVRLSLKNNCAARVNALEEVNGVLGVFSSDECLRLFVDDALTVLAEIADAVNSYKAQISAS